MYILSLKGLAKGLALFAFVISFAACSVAGTSVEELSQDSATELAQGSASRAVQSRPPVERNAYVTYNSWSADIFFNGVNDKDIYAWLFTKYEPRRFNYLTLADGERFWFNFEPPKSVAPIYYSSDYVFYSIVSSKQGVIQKGRTTLRLYQAKAGGRNVIYMKFDVGFEYRTLINKKYFAVWRYGAHRGSMTDNFFTSDPKWGSFEYWHGTQK
ncbi:MAG: hypothetical protein ACRCY4_06965 [Brevinema sp.]